MTSTHHEPVSVPTRGALLPGPSAERWDRLALQAGNIFGTRAWHECWWRHFGRGCTPLVLTDDEQEPRVVIALYRSGRMVRQLRMIGHGQADQLGPVCDPGDIGRASAVLEHLLDGPRTDWDVIVLHDVRVDTGWPPRVGARELRRVASPVVALGGLSWTDYLAGRSANLRQQVRSRAARLEREFAVDYRLATEETLADDLQTLFRLHQARWGREAPFARGAQRRFHTDFAATALARGWLRLWTLAVDGRPVGAIESFRFAGADYLYQSGWDPAFERYSPGFLLCVNAVRSAAEDGMSEFRFLRGDEPHKYRFATHDRPVRSMAIAPGWWGTVAVSAAQRRRAR